MAQSESVAQYIFHSSSENDMELESFNNSEEI